jgi:GxxExxY protein
MSKLQHEVITKKIIGCAFEVINELGSGFLESVYEKALLIALTDAGLPAQSQQAIHVIFRNKNVGNFYTDLLVENKVLVELKTVKSIIPQHEAQIINYLNATGINVGLLINFGSPKLEFKRFTRKT